MAMKRVTFTITTGESIVIGPPGKEVAVQLRAIHPDIGAVCVTVDVGDTGLDIEICDSQDGAVDLGGSLAATTADTAVLGAAN